MNNSGKIIGTLLNGREVRWVDGRGKAAELLLPLGFRIEKVRMGVWIVKNSGSFAIAGPEGAICWFLACGGPEDVMEVFSKVHTHPLDVVLALPDGWAVWPERDRKCRLSCWGETVYVGSVEEVERQLEQ